MNLNLNHPLRRFLAPEPDSGGTETVDRGDTLEAPADESGKGGEGEAAQAELLQKELDAKAELAKTAEAGDEAADKDDKADKPGATKESRIPLSRHEKILQKEREARAAVERELKKYQTGSQVADLNADITKGEETVLTLEKEYAKLITDGQSDKAVEVMAKIRKAERDMSEAKSDMKIQAAVARATESARYDIALERIETQFPQLNPDHDDYDAEVAAEVIELKNGYQLQGYTPTEAMQKAVRKELGSKTAAQAKVLDTTPRVDPKDVAAERKKEAALKVVSAVEKTPPETTKVGLDSDKIGGGLSAKAVMGMSQKEFAKLPDEALSRMRGDTI